MERPTLAIETAAAVRSARRLVSNIQLLRDHFPAGFGPLYEAVQSW